jgi:hypothetical protein
VVGGIHRTAGGTLAKQIGSCPTARSQLIGVRPGDPARDHVGYRVAGFDAKEPRRQQRIGVFGEPGYDQRAARKQNRDDGDAKRVRRASPFGQTCCRRQRGAGFARRSSSASPGRAGRSAPQGGGFDAVLVPSMLTPRAAQLGLRQRGAQAGQYADGRLVLLLPHQGPSFRCPRRPAGR